VDLLAFLMVSVILCICGTSVCQGVFISVRGSSTSRAAFEGMGQFAKTEESSLQGELKTITLTPCHLRDVM